MDLVKEPAFAALVMMLRNDYKQEEEQIFLPAGDQAGTYAKEFRTGLMHGLRKMEYYVRDSITKLQENVKKKST